MAYSQPIQMAVVSLSVRSTRTYFQNIWWLFIYASKCYIYQLVWEVLKILKLRKSSCEVELLKNAYEFATSARSFIFTFYTNNIARGLEKIEQYFSYYPFAQHGIKKQNKVPENQTCLLPTLYFHLLLTSMKMKTAHFYKSCPLSREFIFAKYSTKMCKLFPQYVFSVHHVKWQSDKSHDMYVAQCLV